MSTVEFLFSCISLCDFLDSLRHNLNSLCNLCGDTTLGAALMLKHNVLWSVKK